MTQEDVIALVIGVFEDLDITYMVAGSFASSLHGVPRMTNDADIVLDTTLDTLLELVNRLDPHFYVSEEAAREAVRLRRQFNAIHYDTGFKVDLVIKKDRAFSDAEMKRRLPGQLGGRAVSFASAEDTILTKLEWARAGDSERQFEDAVGIIQVSDDRLDWDYLHNWADELSLSPLLARAREGRPFHDT